jgi:dihydroxy-acid dehydratase
MPTPPPPRRKAPHELRSARWFAPDDFRSFGHRSRTLQMGLGPEDWVDKPVIAIVNTWSDAQPCHQHFRQRAEDVRRGILQAGGFPLELPALSLSESYVKPSTMLYRNLLAMETEELLRSHPVDGAVLMGGCDKTTPALVMGALSMGLPFVYVPAGPMLRGNYRGEVLGSGTDAFRYWDERRAGTLSQAQWLGVEGGIARSHGHCMTMGTASTMTAIAEALGLTMPGASAIPAPDAHHPRMCAAAGRRAVEMVWEDLRPEQVMTPAAVRNAAIVAMATGCSTNAIIHLVAMARRAGVPFTLDELDAIGRRTPVIANVRPSGQGYLMEDFYYAGGLPALMKTLGGRLDLATRTVSGRTLGEDIAGAEVFNADVIRPLDKPVYPEGSLAVLRGNLAPDGAVIKPAACDPKFHRHRGPALVADSYPQMKAIIDDEGLDISPDTVLVLRNAGPQGGPGMPEWGMIPMPKALLRRGHRDMLRLSDARMSGTSYGACVLHVAPEAYVGGPLALLENGDIVEIDIPARTLNMQVSEEALARRRAAWVPPPPRFHRGYGWMFARHVQQADQGCDFDFLGREFGPAAGEPDIY